ncbi:MAG: small ribosomal subunit biogenesis GTPase RsgA [Halioglobus sp.]|nr:small ribosomal subunit biogenesis GTPase RsgA [Halioglobus sp.]
MGKRKLNRRQTRRIGKLHGERAQRAAREASAPAQVRVDGALGPEREGLVIAHHGKQVVVESESGIPRRCHLRANLEGLVTGDRVVWCESEPTGVVVAQLPRQNELSRPDARGALKPVAANIDQMVIVVAPVPQPHANLIDRYLVAAETLAIEPLILLNKSDLLDEAPQPGEDVTDLLAPYPAIGYRVLQSCNRPGAKAPLAAALRGRVSVLVGQSGVGKSSLVNTLVPQADVAVGELSANRGKGRHTTSTARLLHLGCGGSLIDSPGIREFGLWPMHHSELAWGFREFRRFLGNCRFRDCNHEREPGCAILEAVASGAISERRLQSYRHIAGAPQC